MLQTYRENSENELYRLIERDNFREKAEHIEKAIESLYVKLSKMKN